MSRRAGGLRNFIVGGWEDIEVIFHFSRPLSSCQEDRFPRIVPFKLDEVIRDSRVRIFVIGLVLSDCLCRRQFDNPKDLKQIFQQQRFRLHRQDIKLLL